MKQDISFIHTGDIHLGTKFIGLGPKGAEQRRQIRETLMKIAEVAISKQVDFILFAGDTFDSNRPSPESIVVFKKFIQLLTTQHIPVLIISGTHDPWNDECILSELEKELNNQFVFLNNARPSWQHPTKAVTVYGVSLKGSNFPERPLSVMKKQTEEGWHIGMVHAAIDMGYAIQEARITKQEIAESSLDYLAMGHWHNAQELSQSKTICWYCGSPELIAVDEEGQGHVLHVSLHTEEKIKVEKIVVGTRRVVKLELEAASNDRLIEKITPHIDTEKIVLITINGICPINIQMDIDELYVRLKPLFFHVRISNKSTCEVTDDEIAHYTDTTIIGRYVSLLKKQIEHAEEEQKSKLEEALQLGVAMLTGREVEPWL